MKYFVASLAVLLTLGIGTANAQQTEDNNNASDQSLPPPAVFYSSYREPLEIRLHQSAVIADKNMEIIFSKIVEDSRCPSDVTCVWQGRIAIQVDIQTKNESRNIILSLENATVPINDEYSFVLLDVKPYPTSKNPIQKKDYVVILQLEQTSPFPSPLKQIKAGIALIDVTCNEGKIPAYKYNAMSVACVSLDTESQLVKRGWALLRLHMYDDDPSRALCERYGGNWLEEYSECEYISLQQCSLIGGKFSECESACRHDPAAEICTLQCVFVCSVDENQK
ncbi:MAG: hypothetical protein FJ360_02125 [Thaumarchaeota archaeon]|nr:hypothetical protein [Nitrososphaerota archaeon]